MASVRLNAVFPPGATVELVRARSHADTGAAGDGDVAASGKVGKDSSLVIAGLQEGSYFARATGKHKIAAGTCSTCGQERDARTEDVDLGTVQVRAKGDDDEQDLAADPPPPRSADTAPADPHAVNKSAVREVSGARTSANAHAVEQESIAKRAAAQAKKFAKKKD